MGTMKADICCLLLLVGVLIGFEAIAAARNPNFNLNVNLRPPRNDGRGTNGLTFKEYYEIYDHQSENQEDQGLAVSVSEIMRRKSKVPFNPFLESNQPSNPFADDGPKNV